MRWVTRKYKEILNYLCMSPYAYKFDTFVRSWKITNPINWLGVHVPFDSGLVSIILPSFNGEELISEAMDSLLAQTYQNIEIIAINDGSSDRTGEILESYATKDSRVKVYHQENQKIPKTLSRGSRLARGEFLTWTSIDNRLKHNCIEMLVGSMQRNPDWDMVYANIDIIDDDGKPLTGSNWYSRNQVPPGSEHVHLRDNTDELNTWDNNLVGAAFLYRARVAWVIGDYSASKFLVEDYDYWMRVNELMTLRHADFSECIYDYRFHGNSLTSKDKELGIASKRTMLMGFDDFRRSFYLTNSVWIVTDDGSAAGQRLSKTVQKELAQRKSVVIEAESASSLTLPRLWMPVVQMHCAETVQSSRPLPVLHDTACRICLCPEQGPVRGEDWDFFITTDSIPAADLLRLEDGYRGWWSVSAVSDLITLCEIQAKNKQLREIDSQALAIQPSVPNEGSQSLSVVICTDRHSASLENCLRSLMNQTLASKKYDVVLVNTNPFDPTVSNVLEKIQAEFGNQPMPQIALIDCPLPGLACARNAGLSECRGGFVVFIDDDAIAKSDCLQHLADAFASIPHIGVMGGHTELNVPEPRPEGLLPEQERFLGQYLTDYKTCTEIKKWQEFPSGSLWGASRRALIEMGGFRCNSNRIINDAGGQNVVTALLARKLGYGVWVEPRAEVLRDVESLRYTRQHIEQTIKSGIMADYKLQTELYLPAESTLASVTRDYISSVSTRATLLAKRFLRRDKLANVEALHALFHARGLALVFRQKILDDLRRFYKPIVHK